MLYFFLYLKLEFIYNIFLFKKILMCFFYRSIYTIKNKTNDHMLNIWE